MVYVRITGIVRKNNLFIKKASKSGLEKYNACAWDYMLSYVVGLRSPSGKSAVLGTICHWVLEVLAERTKRKKIHTSSKFNSPFYLLQVSFNGFQKREKIQLEEKDLKVCGKWLNNILGTTRDPRVLNVLDTERGFMIEFDLPGFQYNVRSFHTGEYENGNFRLNGYIDLINEIEEDGEKVLEVVDYKFGKYSTDWATGEEKTEDNINKDLQLRCYNLAVRKLYPNYKKYKFTVVYVQLGKILSCYLDEDDVVVTIDHLRRSYRKILNDEHPIRLRDDSTRREHHYKCRNVCYFGKTKNEQGISLCEEYYALYRKFGIHEGAKSIYQLTVNNRPPSRPNTKGSCENITWSTE